jgi:hypothetical protein
MQNRIRSHIRTNVVAYVALFFALGGGAAWATHPGGADTISSADIINNEVKTQDIRDANLTTADIRARAVTTGKLADGAVTEQKLANGAVNSSKVEDGSLGIGEFSSSIPAARVTNSVDQPAGQVVFATLGFDSERYDTANMHDPQNNSRLTAPATGIYLVTAQVRWEGGSGTIRELRVRRNGDTTVAEDRLDDTTNFANGQSVTTQLILQAGDFVQVQVALGPDTEQDIKAFAEFSPEFSMTWLAPGP